MVLVKRRGLVADGALFFGELPQTVLWAELRDHMARLAGVEKLSLLTNNVTEGWIEFSWQGHKFAINDQFGDYWFFVKDPGCPDEILESLLAHCSRLLGAPRKASDEAA